MHAVPLAFHTQPHTKYKTSDPIANPIVITCSDRVACARAVAVVMPYSARWNTADLQPLARAREAL